MSNAFTNFLGSALSGLANGDQSQMRDYQHADRLFVRDTYARAPKFGFLYFVVFNISKTALSRDPVWNKSGPRTIGLLVKKIDLPKFQLQTETVNQYNRKTVVQTHIKYQPISLDFHDDNGDLTTGLWRNYYNYYYGDGVSGTQTTVNPTTNKSLGGIVGFLGGLFKGRGGPDSVVSLPASFVDTKYNSGKTANFNYGLNNGQSDPFFSTIDIYVLHQHKFTQYTLLNPIITEWSHDTLDSDAGNKVLANKMQLAYESVIYNSGRIKKGSAAATFTAEYYDATPSPLSVGGKGSASLLGPGGLIAGAGDVLGSIEDGNYLGAFLQARTVAQNASKLTSNGIRSEATGLLLGTLNNVSANAGQGSAGIGGSIRSGILGGAGFDTGGNPATSAIARKLTGN